MKVPFSWLQEFVSIRVGVEELARRLTLGGLEVETILTVDGEKVLEINVSPNRGDCLSILGMAREVGALMGLRIRGPEKIPLSRGKGIHPVSVGIKAPRKCPWYTMAVVAGVTVGPSPDWLVRRLALVGIRSVNNVVDVTNYVLMEQGQPLHAFDREKIRGGRIFVRAAQVGEKILALDGEERDLKPDDLVIADSEGAVAVAGVMGGKGSEISPESTTIALESAFFDPASVRRTSRRLGLQTESSFRFERRVDPGGVLPALYRAVALIQKVGGGGLSGSVVTEGQCFSRPRRIPFFPSEVESLLGGRWTVSEIRRAFSRLSFPVKGKRRWEVSVPSWRGDLTRSVDLIEEIGRLEGLEKIPASFPSLHGGPRRSGDDGLERERRIRCWLAHRGFREAIHLSFLAPASLSAFDPSLLDRSVVLENPLGAEYSVMRPTLLPSLLQTAGYHHRHKIFTVRLFELGNSFQRDSEVKLLAAILTGEPFLSHWSERPREVDFYDVKGVVEGLLGEAGVGGGFSFDFGKEEAPFLHPGRQAVIRSGGRRMGVAGEIHPDLCDRFELKRRAFVFELEEDAVLSGPRQGRGFEEYSRHPVVERDLSVIVDEAVPAGGIGDFLKAQDPTIRGVRVFDLYRGSQVPPGKKSLTFSLQMGLPDRTLTDEEVNAIFGDVIERVRNEFGAEVR